MHLIPVIAIDGPSASGKGTVAQAVAGELGFHYLDSGALYRIVGLAVMRVGGNLDIESEVLSTLLHINIKFHADQVLLDGADVAEAIRAEPVSGAASKVGAHAKVRLALLQRQRDFRQPPGLVAGISQIVGGKSPIIERFTSGANGAAFAAGHGFVELE